MAEEKRGDKRRGDRRQLKEEIKEETWPRKREEDARGYRRGDKRR